MASLGQLIRDPNLDKAIETFWKAGILPQLKIETPNITIADTAWQREDWAWTWNQRHCCHCRARGGSKSHDFVNYVIFRVLRTGEKWAWLAAKSGQLTQAMIYFKRSPFFKSIEHVGIGSSNRTYIQLIDGSMIMIGIVSTSNLGMRLDGIVIDEEEDMEQKQTEDVYPQMEGMMTVSPIGQFIHLGTLWVGTLYNEHTELYPTKIRSWDQIPHLVNSTTMQEIIADPNIPEWQKDLLYRCIPTVPYGLLFPDIKVVDRLPENGDERWGLDFGGVDNCVGVRVDEQRNEIIVFDERELDVERNPACVDFLATRTVEAESGGYNDSNRYGEKSKVLQVRVQASVHPVTNQWKAERQMFARGCTIIICPTITPGTYQDLRNAVFGDDGLYLKDKSHPCHKLDAFFHAIRAQNRRYFTQSPVSTIRANEQKREQLTRFTQRR